MIYKPIIYSNNINQNQIKNTIIYDLLFYLLN